MGVVGRIGVSIGVAGALALSLLVMGAPASAQSALVDVLSKRVTLTHPGDPAGEIAVGQVIRSGDTVATDDNGRAVVTYPDGSTTVSYGFDSSGNLTSVSRPPNNAAVSARCRRSAIMRRAG